MIIKKFNIGDTVYWNSEAGHVSGKIIAIKTQPFVVKGKDGTPYLRHATATNPQYAVKSLISNHVAHHFGSSLSKRPL